MKRIKLFLFLVIIPFCLGAQIYTDYIGAGHDQGVIVTSSSQENPHQMSINGSGIHNMLDASRFLSHATLGANIEQIANVNTIGYDAWLEEQMNLPATSYLDLMVPIHELYYDYYLELGNDPEEYFIGELQFRYAWSHIIRHAPDVLRHRVALALSEILVISTQSDLVVKGYGLGDYYDVLSQNAFGNYKDLLMDITLHPTMGFYLSHLNNPKTNPIENTHPDENYAREIMQLFSIGLYELNPDGTRVLENGQAIPTYDSDDIAGLAKVFTGLGMTDWDPIYELTFPPFFGAPIYAIDATLPMTMYELHHEPGEKHIVGDFTIPEGQSGIQDIEMAIDHIFNHPNVGPFIGRLLIQRLVKSNPTPEYIERITNVFNDNGNGVRGNMGAVVKAILLDEEARSCEWISHETNGRLKEPIQRWTQVIKGFNATTDEWFWNTGFVIDYFMAQYPMSSPTVFNFFLPDYQPNSLIADEDLVAPEFQIFNSNTSLGYMNFSYFTSAADFYNDLPEEEFTQLGILDQYKAQLNDPIMEALAAEPSALVDYLDLVMAHGNMSDETRQIIFDAIDPIIDFPEAVTKMALYLTMISPDYVIMK